jgi:hypothetical protein
MRLLASTRRELAAAAGIDEAELPALLDRLRSERAETTGDEIRALAAAAAEQARAADRSGVGCWFPGGVLPAGDS